MFTLILIKGCLVFDNGVRFDITKDMQQHLRGLI